MATHRWSVWIDAPAEKVFAVYTDIDRLPEWEVGLRKIEDVTGPGDRPGTTYAARYGPFASRSEVVGGLTHDEVGQQAGLPEDFLDRLLELRIIPLGRASPPSGAPTSGRLREARSPLPEGGGTVRR